MGGVGPESGLSGSEDVWSRSPLRSTALVDIDGRGREGGGSPCMIGFVLMAVPNWLGSEETGVFDPE